MKFSRIIQSAFLFFALSIAFSSLSFAGVEQGMTELSLYGGILFGDDAGSTTVDNVNFSFGDTDDTFGFGAALGYNFSKFFTTELSLSYWPNSDFSGTATDGTSTIDVSTSTKQFHVFVNGVLHIFPEEDFVPYLTAGVGGVVFSGDVTGLGQTLDYGEYGFGFNIGGGVKWFFTDSLNLRFEVKDVIASMEHLDTMNMWRTTVGVGIIF